MLLSRYESEKINNGDLGVTEVIEFKSTPVCELSNFAVDRKSRALTVNVIFRLRRCCFHDKLV